MLAVDEVPAGSISAKGSHDHLQNYDGQTSGGNRSPKSAGATASVEATRGVQRSKGTSTGGQKGSCCSIASAATDIHTAESKQRTGGDGDDRIQQEPRSGQRTAKPEADHAGGSPTRQGIDTSDGDHGNGPQATA